MANRYLRASGNWNGPVWAATSNGAAGSASTPTADDYVFIYANYTVTLNQDAQIQRFIQTSGGINLSSYTLSTGSFDSSSGTRSINLASGRMIVSNQFGNSAATIFNISGGSLTLTAGSSIVEFRGNPNGRTISLGNNTFNDVFLNFGVWGVASSQTLNITGSPTFRSLIIQSKNSAAHTVNFDNGEDVSQINLEKLVVIGASTSNRLTLSSGFMASISPSKDGATSYGQYARMQRVHADGWVSGEDGPTYIGSNSATEFADGWLLQDPPKAETLVDDLKANPGSNTNFNVTGTINKRTDGLGGGGYAGTNGATMISKDTYDMIGSRLIIERPAVTPGDGEDRVGVGDSLEDITIRELSLATSSVGYDGEGEEGTIAARYSSSNYGNILYLYPISEPKYIRIEVALNGYFTIGHSDNGQSWTTATDGYLNEIEMLLLRSTRVKVDWYGATHIGSIGILPEADLVTGNFLPFFMP